jgi:hypothetical protein
MVRSEAISLDRLLVKCSKVERTGWCVSEWDRGLRRFSPCGLLLLVVAGGWGTGTVREPRVRGTGTGFLRVLRSPLPIRIPPIAPQSSSIIWKWYDRLNCGRSTKWTKSQPMKKIKKGGTSSIESRYQATTDEDLMCAEVNCRVCELATCSYDLLVLNKSNYKSKPRL